MPARRAPTLVWARLAASPLSEAGQAPAFAAIARAAAAVRAEYPGFNAAYTGVNTFAAASRARIEHEVTWLNALSLAAVLAVAFTFIRGVHRGLHLVPVVLLSVLGAWVAATMVFDRLHILVFVVGSLLAGVAIDYGFYLFMQPPAFPGEDYWAKVRRLAKPLLASCLTTVAGFALLLFSELPFIRQLGVFVGAGLVCALAAAVVYFSTVRNPFLETRSFRGGLGLPPAWRRNFRRLLVVVWIVALPGLALLKWKDDIRELDTSSPELNREHARITGLFGQQDDRTVYLTYGDSVAEARAALEKFDGWLQAAGGGRTSAIGLGAVVPTAAVHAEAVQFAQQHPEFPGQLRAALVAAGFDDAEFAAFFEGYAKHVAAAKATDLDAALGALQAKLTGPGRPAAAHRPAAVLVRDHRGRRAGRPAADRHAHGEHQPAAVAQPHLRALPAIRAVAQPDRPRAGRRRCAPLLWLAGRRADFRHSLRGVPGAFRLVRLVRASAQPVPPARRLSRRVPDAQLLDLLRHLGLQSRTAAGVGAAVGADDRRLLRRAGVERHPRGPCPRLDRGADGGRRAAGDRV